MPELTTILESAERKTHLEQLNNQALAVRLLEKVWAHMDLFSEESDLITVAIDRIKRAG